MINILTHPFLEHYLTILRTKPSLSHFRFSLGKISHIVSVLATADLPVEEIHNLEDESRTYSKYTEKTFLLPIVPSGLPLEEAFRGILPNSQIGFVAYTSNADGTYDESICFLPENIKDSRTFILDFGISSGGTISSVISRLQFEEVSLISVVAIFATAEGIEKIHSEFPDVPITICSLESVDGSGRFFNISDYFVSYNKT